MTTEYEIRLYKELHINPAIREQAGETRFREFLNRELPQHVAYLGSSLQETPELLEIDEGRLVYVSSYHTLNTKTGDIEIAIHSELLKRSGTVLTWRTTVMTLRELEEWERGSNEVLQ
jgi:hypothetical protein